MCQNVFTTIQLISNCWPIYVQLLIDIFDIIMIEFEFTIVSPIFYFGLSQQV